MPDERAVAGAAEPDTPAVVKRILLRSRKGPFEALPPAQMLERNLIGTNSGNLIFLQAAYKLLATQGTQIELYSRPDQADAVWINERCDVYVIPLANAFRHTFEPHLIALTQLIQKLTIPVVVLGVGAQSDLTYETDSLKSIEGSVKAFVGAVLKRAPSIGVRGEFSRHYLEQLGFRDVEVIGCPSMFLHGDKLSVERKVPALDGDARVSVNISPEVEMMGRLALFNLARYPNLTYVAQDLDTLALLLWHEAPTRARGSDPFPLHLAHPLFLQNRVKFFVDPWPWIDYMKGLDFAFGTRIHGNIAALLAGTPAFVLAHDSRTLELAQYFDIPHRTMDEVGPRTDAAQLYEEADFSRLTDGHAHRFATFAAFLQRHGLDHVFGVGEDPSLFDARVAAATYPPAVELGNAGAEPPRVSLGRRLRLRLRRLSRSRWARRLRAAADRR